MKLVELHLSLMFILTFVVFSTKSGQGEVPQKVDNLLPKLANWSYLYDKQFALVFCYNLAEQARENSELLEKLKTDTTASGKQLFESLSLLKQKVEVPGLPKKELVLNGLQAIKSFLEEPINQDRADKFKKFLELYTASELKDLIEAVRPFEPLASKSKELGIAIRDATGKLLPTAPITPESKPLDSKGVAPITPFGLAWQSQLIYAMTDLIIDRAKAELTITFLNGFKKKLDEWIHLNKGDSIQLKAIFNNTYNLLFPAENGDVSQLFPITANLRAALLKDLQELPVALADNLLTGDDQVAVKLAINLVKELERGTRLNVALVEMTKIALVEAEKDSTFKLAVLTQLLFTEQYFKDTTGFYEYMQVDKKSTAAKLLARYFLTGAGANLGFYQKIANDTTDPVSAICDSAVTFVWSRLQSLYASAAKLSHSNETSNEVDKEKKAEKERKTEVFAAYVDAAFDILESPVEMIRDKEAKEELKAKIAKIKSVRQFYNAMREKNYSGAVVVALNFAVDYWRPEPKYEKKEIPYRQVEHELDPMGSEYTARSGVNKTKMIIENKEQIEKASDAQRNFYKYLTLAAGLASAQTSDDMKKALEAVAMPVGGYRAKRTQGLLTINAYAGVAYGREKLDIENDNIGSHFSAWVPVGFEVNYKHVGLFLSVLDLGAVASYRVSRFDTADTTTKVENDPVLGFKEVISPGIFVMVGLPWKLPFSLGAGIQRTAELRQLNSSGMKVGRPSVTRVSVVAAMDLPLFHLYKF